MAAGIPVSYPRRTPPEDSVQGEATVFTHEELGDVREITGEDGTPWFVVADVCRALDRSNPTMMIRSLPDAYKSTLSIIEGGLRST